MEYEPWDAQRLHLMPPSWRLTLHPGNSTAMLPGHREKTCNYCGEPVQWLHRFDEGRVPLVPCTFPTWRIPPRYRWQIETGRAQPGDLGRRDCYVAHPAMCPAVEQTDLAPDIEDLRRAAARRMRRRLDAGFVPRLPPATEEEAMDPEPDPAVTEAERHVIDCHGRLLILPGTVPTLRCVAFAQNSGERCHNSVLRDYAEGTWVTIDIPHAPGRTGRHLATYGGMWVWQLASYDYSRTRQWLRQRCSAHPVEGVSPDLVQIELTTFKPLVHITHIARERPAAADKMTPKTPRQAREGGRLDAPVPCAGEGCTNGNSAGHVEEGWLCYQCRRKAVKRQSALGRHTSAPHAAPEPPERANETAPGEDLS